MIFSFEFTPTPPALSRQAVNIISAVSVDRRQVEQELKQLQDSDKKKKVTEEKRQKELEKQASEAKEKRLVEEKKLAACWVGHFGEGQIKRILKVPDKGQIEAVIPIGYEFKKERPSKKVDLDAVLYFESYGNKKMVPPKKLEV